MPSSAQPCSSSFRRAASSFSFHAAPYASTTSFTATTTSRDWTPTKSSPCQRLQELLAAGAVRRLVPPASAQLDDALENTRRSQHIIRRLQQPRDPQPGAQHLAVLAGSGGQGAGEVPDRVGLMRRPRDLRIDLSEPGPVVGERRAVP